MPYELPKTRANWPALAHAGHALDIAQAQLTKAQAEVRRLRCMSAGVSVGDRIRVLNPRGSSTVKAGTEGVVTSLEFSGGNGGTDRLNMIELEPAAGLRGKPRYLWPNSAQDFEVIGRAGS